MGIIIIILISLFSQSKAAKIWTSLVSLTESWF